MDPSIKSLFLLDPDIIFLNHGSFGACPKPVFEAYQAWQRRLESQPVRFLGRELPSLQKHARQILGLYLHADADDLVFIPNATHGVNIVAHSLVLSPGDEILTTDHEYGACDNTWELICLKSGAKYIHHPIPLPMPSPEVMVNSIWNSVTPRTRLIFLSHVSSPTAQRLPVEQICQRAKKEGILTLIDGAHAPGQIPLDLTALAADFYTGNCHKWMLSPKGAAFLFVAKERQALIQPLIVSWGYSASAATTTGSQFIDFLQWTGTHDPSAALSVPAAVQFLEIEHWLKVRASCRRVLTTALSKIDGLTGLPSAYANEYHFDQQMAIARLPHETDLVGLKTKLYDDYRIEVPLIEWRGEKFIRISVQIYNTQDDIDRLIEAFSDLLPQPGASARL